jgi:hypothetical protein
LTTVLTPGDFQLYDWDFPVLKNAEREAALGYKVRAAVPLNPEEYRVFSAWFTHPKKSRALAIVLKKADVQRLGLDDPSLRILLPFSYRLRTRRTGSKEIGVGVDHWTADYENGVFRRLSFSTQEMGGGPDPGPMTGLIEVGRSYRQGTGTGITVLLTAGALVWLGVTLVQYTAERDHQVAVWRAWLTEHPAVDSGATTSKELAAKRVRAGFPLWRATQALALAWGNSHVRIQSLAARHRELTIEARGPSSLQALERLKSQPGFEHFQLTTSRRVAGHDEFLLEGEVTLEP